MENCNTLDLTLSHFLLDSTSCLSEEDIMVLFILKCIKEGKDTCIVIDCLSIEVKNYYWVLDEFGRKTNVIIDVDLYDSQKLTEGEIKIHIGNIQKTWINRFSKYGVKDINHPKEDNQLSDNYRYIIDQKITHHFEINKDLFQKFAGKLEQGIKYSILTSEFAEQHLLETIKKNLEEILLEKGKILIDSSKSYFNIPKDLFYKALVLLAINGDICIDLEHNVSKFQILLNYSFKGVYFDEKNGDVFLDGELLGNLSFETKPYFLFKYLYERKGTPVSHQEIYVDIIKHSKDGTSGAVSKLKGEIKNKQIRDLILAPNGYLELR